MDMAGSGLKDDDDAITEINVTPLVDVSLVLVIIFMAIAPFGLQAGIQVLQSKAKASVGKVQASQNVNVRLTKDGKLTVNGKKTTFAKLWRVIAKSLGKSKDKMVILTADAENRVGDVVTVLDTARQAGAKKLAIVKSEGTKG